MCSNRDDNRDTTGYKLADLTENFEKDVARPQQLKTGDALNSFGENTTTIAPVQSNGAPFSKIKADPYRRGF